MEREASVIRRTADSFRDRVGKSDRFLQCFNLFARRYDIVPKESRSDPMEVEETGCAWVPAEGWCTYERWLVHHLNLDPMKVLRPEVLQKLRSAPSHHGVMHISGVNGEIRAMITNTVHCTMLVDEQTRQPYRLPLGELARNLLYLGSQYNTERFAKLVQRYGPTDKMTHLIFNTGNVVEAGSVSFPKKRAQIYALQDHLRAAGHPTVTVGPRRCQNIVSTAVCFPLRLSLMQLLYPAWVEYKPADFAGAVIRHPELQRLMDQHGAEGVDAVEDQMSATAVYYQQAEERAEGISLALEGDSFATSSDSSSSSNKLDMRLCEAMDADAAIPATVGKGSETGRRDGGDNIVVLAFQYGCIVCVGAKNLKMLEAAYQIVYQVLQRCRDTDENRRLEAQLLEKNLATGGDIALQLTGTSNTAGAAPAIKRRSRKPRKATLVVENGRVTKARPRAHVQRNALLEAAERSKKLLAQPQQ